MRNNFDSFLSQTLEYTQLPKKLDQTLLSELFKGLISGDKVADVLIKGHMRLAMAIVAERATPRWADELVGTVFLELVKRIDWVRRGKNKKELTDETLTPYLAHAMRARRNDFLSTFPHICGMPARTLRSRNEKGEEVELRSVFKFEDYDEYLYARREEPSIEITEILSLAIRTEHERRVINFRAQGYSYREISSLYPLSLPRIAQLNHAVEERFDILMLG